MDKYLLSDEYLVRSGNITTRIYIFGNSKGENIKPRIQVELKDLEGKIIWDKNYDKIPLSKSDLNEINKKIMNYTWKKERDSVVISKWDNGAQKYIELGGILMTGWNIKKLFQEILLDSHQSSNYLARKAYDILWERDEI